MIQLIAFIIFIISISVVLFILYKKIPVLAELPQNGHHGFNKPELFLKLEKKIRGIHFSFFEKKVFLHKLLSKFRVLVLKIETKVDKLLHGIRKKAQELDEKNGKK